MSNFLDDTRGKRVTQQVINIEETPAATTNFSPLEDLSNQIFKFVNHVNKFESMASQLGTSRETDTLRKNLSKERESTKNKAKDLMDRIKKAELDKEFLKDSLERDQFNKMKRQFMEQFEKFTHTAKQSIELERKTSKRKSQRYPEKQTLLIEEVEVSNVAVANTNEGKEQIQKKKVSKQQTVVVSEAILSTRATELEIAKQTMDDLKHLEQDMADLKTCYVDLKNLIEEQQEGLDQITKNVMDSNQNVEQAVVEIKEANKHQKAGGYATLILLGVAIVVILIAAAVIVVGIL